MARCEPPANQPLLQTAGHDGVIVFKAPQPRRWRAGPLAASRKRRLRVHPISLALRYLKGRRTMRAAPYRGAPLFESDEAAADVLRKFTGRDFGTNAIGWGNWLSRNRWVYYASAD